jgi:hypothetical protein
MVGNHCVLEIGGLNASRATTRFAKMTAPVFKHIFTGIIRQGSDQDAALEAWDVRDQVVPRGSAGRAV